MIENAITGVILLILGFAFFAVRLYYVAHRKRKRLMKALETEIKEMRLITAD